MNNSIDFLKDINNYPTRKLIYICDQSKIPLPMKPTRECLIKSIESFYSTRESNKKEKTPREKTPKEKPKVKSRNYVLETPKISTNRDYLIEDPISTPTCGYCSPPNSSRIQSHK